MDWKLALVASASLLGCVWIITANSQGSLVSFDTDRGTVTGAAAHSNQHTAGSTCSFLLPEIIKEEYLLHELAALEKLATGRENSQPGISNFEDVIASYPVPKGFATTGNGQAEKFFAGVNAITIMHKRE